MFFLRQIEHWRWNFASKCLLIFCAECLHVRKIVRSSYCLVKHVGRSECQFRIKRSLPHLLVLSASAVNIALCLSIPVTLSAGTARSALAACSPPLAALIPHFSSWRRQLGVPTVSTQQTFDTNQQYTYSQDEFCAAQVKMYAILKF